MTDRPWVAYVGPFLFPWGQAASRRVLGVAQSLVMGGYDVVVVSGSSSPGSLTHFPIDGSAGSLSYIGLGTCPDQGESQVRKAYKLMFGGGRRIIEWLDAQPRRPSHVVQYGGYTPFLVRLLPWCRRWNVPLLSDVVEWYEPHLQRGGALGLSNINVSVAMNLLMPRCSGLICISSFLADHFRALGVPVLRVPPTLDLSSTSPPGLARKNGGRPLTLLYAGVPGKKDLLREIIHGIELVDRGAGRVRLVVAGPEAAEVARLTGFQTTIPEWVQVLGRVSQDEVPALYEAADFSVLLREPLRFANAGFPTKVVESFASSTPVIANLTSDLGEYLHDGLEGLVVRDHSIQAFAESVGRALSLSSDEIGEMGRRARGRAEVSFDYRAYGDPLRRFFDSISSRSRAARQPAQTSVRGSELGESVRGVDECEHL